MAQIAVTALSPILAADLTSDNEIITFTPNGNTNRVNLFEAVEAGINVSCDLTLDKAYDSCGAGAGREIVADTGAVKISGEDGLLVTGTFGSGAAAEISGSGTRMFFNPAKAAFRAGEADDDEWDDANIGDYSVALGWSPLASGEGSVAFGNFTMATGDFSTAFGADAVASGLASTAFGASSIASGDFSTALGDGITAVSYAEVSVGAFNTDYIPTSTTDWEATDRLFVIGNGQSSGTRADALIITKDGNTTMPTTTGAFSPPVLTTTERNALTPTAGMMIYNSTDSKHQGYDGTSWNNFY
jgi:hypothetical protein